ncbi:MAG: sulfotransferase [Pseudomonadota bacterium]
MTERPLPPRFPDFIIGGAPKCGTSSLHGILAQHDAIGMPEAEIHYFDADDPITHPDFLDVRGGALHWYDTAAVDNLDWYARQFAPFRDAPCVGEDSTTYLFSEAAPERIKAFLPDVKLIFMLRDPVKRAYSQYWHLACSARMNCGFEQGLLNHTSMVLGSTYAPHLRRYFDVFGRDRVRVILFEDFLGGMQGTMDGVTDYLGVPAMDLSTARTWFNQTRYPTHPRAHQALNRVGAYFVTRRYRNHMEARSDPWAQLQRKLHDRWFRHVNPTFLKADKPPPMRDDTRAYLAQHLSARNAGLSDLLGRDLSQVWPGFTG